MANGLHKYTVQEAENAKLGQAGYVYGSASADGSTYVAITAVAAAQVDTTSDDTGLFPNLSNVPIPAGATIYGRWTSIQTYSGGCIAYVGE